MGKPASNGLWWISLQEVSAPPATNPNITDVLMRQRSVRGFFRTDRHLPTSGRTIRGHRLRKLRLLRETHGASAACTTASMPKTRGKRSEDECP